LESTTEDPKRHRFISMDEFSGYYLLVYIEETFCFGKNTISNTITTKKNSMMMLINWGKSMLYPPKTVKLLRDKQFKIMQLLENKKKKL